MAVAESKWRWQELVAAKAAEWVFEYWAIGFGLGVLGLVLFANKFPSTIPIIPVLYSNKFNELVLLKCLFLLVVLVGCSPLGEPVKCSTKDSNCTVTNSYGAFPDRTVCRVGNVVYPTSEQELVSIVSVAIEVQRKMKVVTQFSHSIPKLVCPDGQDGLLISTKNLNLYDLIMN
ncbi:hypothetical protein Gotur_008296 [Gossypium turneri]